MRRNDKEYTLKKAFRKTPFFKYTPCALNQRSPAEGKGKGQKLLAQGIALGNDGCKPVAL